MTFKSAIVMNARRTVECYVVEECIGRCTGSVAFGVADDDGESNLVIECTHSTI